MRSGMLGAAPPTMADLLSLSALPGVAEEIAQLKQRLGPALEAGGDALDRALQEAIGSQVAIFGLDGSGAIKEIAGASSGAGGAAGVGADATVFGMSEAQVEALEARCAKLVGSLETEAKVAAAKRTATADGTRKKGHRKSEFSGFAKGFLSAPRTKRRGAPAPPPAEEVVVCSEASEETAETRATPK
eukprot:6539929-Prymnesium_polylepis.1